MLLEQIERILKSKYRSKISSTKNRTDKNGDPIEMRLSYEEWKTLWLAFGKLPGHPYVLSRKDDIGHYEINNVFIQHVLENSAQAMGKDTEMDKRINEYCLSTGYKRRIVKKMIERGELDL